ncbi:MAG: hypothetical protein ACPGXK_12590 [Phycisphaerae bacterium]
MPLPRTNSVPSSDYRYRFAHIPCGACVLFSLLLSACATDTGGNGGTGNGGTGNGGSGNGGTSDRWQSTIQSDSVGALKGVWADGTEDAVFVGGAAEQGQVYRLRGDAWKRDVVGSVELLRDVIGFSSDEIYVIGDRGTFISFDGTRWSDRFSDTEEDLYGIWGSSGDDLWMVGGDVGDDAPVIVRGDEGSFRRFTVPDNDVAATALFDIWGIGERAWAVGENGLILELVDGAWVQVPAGEGFVENIYAVHGIDESTVIAVGGSESAQVSLFDGESWSTEVFDDVPGLRAVEMASATEVFVGGLNGYAARFEPTTGAFTMESTATEGTIGALADTGSASRYAAADAMTFPESGSGLIRFDNADSQADIASITISCGNSSDCDGPSSCDAAVCEALPSCATDTDCDNGDVCLQGGCISSALTPCDGESDCALGEDCGSVVCEDAGNIDMQYFYENDGELERIPEGGEAPAFRGFQGGIHTFVSFQSTGLTPGENVLFGIEIVRADDGDFLASQRTFRIPTTEPEEGITQALNLFVTFDRARPGELDGVEAIMRMSISDAEDLTLSDDYEQRVVLVEMDE